MPVSSVWILRFFMDFWHVAYFIGNCPVTRPSRNFMLGAEDVSE